jgi:DNA repair photolyase
MERDASAGTPPGRGLSVVRSILLGMLQTTLFSSLTGAPGTGPEPLAPHRPRGSSAHALRHDLHLVHGRRVLTTTALERFEIDELARAARFGPIEVRYRIPTPDRRLAAVLDPHAPAPPLRLASLRAAKRAGLVAGVTVSPLIPGVNDLERDLVQLFAAAQSAGAAFVDCEIDVPGPRRQRELVRELRERYPRVAARYEVHLAIDGRPEREERARVAEMVERIGRRFGIPATAHGVTPRDDHGQRRFGFAV